MQKYFKVTQAIPAFMGKYFVMTEAQIKAAIAGQTVECAEMNIHTLEPEKNGGTSSICMQYNMGKFICPVPTVTVEEVNFEDLLFPEETSDVYKVVSARMYNLLFDEHAVEPEPVKATSAADILNTVADTIGNRASERDTESERSMKSCIDAFNAMYGHQLTETEGWMFMAMLKMSRAKSGKFRADDWVDLVGYTALASECEFAQHNKLDSAK